MTSAGSSDVRELRATVDEIDDATKAAEAELDLLLRAMDTDHAGDTSGVEAAPLVTPTVTAETMADRLRAAGFEVRLDVDASADTLDATTQRTLGRILQEATTNALRYAAPGGPCTIALSLRGDVAHVRVTSPLPVGPARSDEAGTGWGLRGLLERVDLTGGELTAGPVPPVPGARGVPEVTGRSDADSGSWVVDARLPRGASAHAGESGVVGRRGVGRGATTAAAPT